MSRSGIVVRNLFSMMLTQGLTWMVSLAVMFYVPKYVGDVTLGRMTLAASFAGIAFLFVNLGTSTVLVRDVAVNRSEAGSYLSSILLQRLVLGIVVTGAVVILTRYLHLDPETKLFISLATALAIIGAMSAGAGDVLRGQENFPRANAASVVEKVVAGVLTVAAIEAKLPFWVLIVCGGVASMASFGMNIAPFLGKLPRPSVQQIRFGWNLIRVGTPFFTNALFVTIYTQCNPIIIERISGDAVLGWYALVVRLFGTFLFIPTTITAAMLPALSRLLSENPDAFPTVARRMVTFILMCAIPVAYVCIFMPGQIIRVMHYPATFMNAVPVFVLFGIGMVLWFLSIAVGTLLTALGLQKEFGRASSKACLFVLPLSIGCIWLTQVYMHNGAIGAAASHIIVEIFMLGCYLRALPQSLLPTNLILGLLGRMSIAALPTAIMLYLVHGNFLWYALAPGVVVYAALSYVLRCVTVQDINLVRSIFSAKTGLASA